MNNIRCFRHPRNWKHDGWDMTERIIVYAPCEGYDPNIIGEAIIYNKHGLQYLTSRGLDGEVECEVDLDRVREVLTDSITKLRNQADLQEKVLNELFNSQ